MKLAVGSILSMTPATGTVTFTTATEQWKRHIIGYAVVVERPLGGRSRDDGAVETGLDIAILGEEGPDTLTNYLHAHWVDGLTWRVATRDPFSSYIQQLPEPTPSPEGTP